MDIQKQSGLPISLNEKGLLEFKPPLTPITPAHRTVADMRDYLADPKATFNHDSVYDMYRDIHLPQDQEIFKNSQIRYDITVFYPGMIGKEFCKTIGHYHPFKPTTKIRYPETYEVISGQALFLMQKMDDSFNKVLEVYLIEAKKGEDVVLLPGFAHFTINTADQILITSNWTIADRKSEYEPVARYHGAAYYVISGNSGQIELVPNKSYSSVPEPIKLRPKELPHFGIINDQPAYFTGQKSPDKLEFLISPELYLDQLSITNCYNPVTEDDSKN